MYLPFCELIETVEPLDTLDTEFLVSEEFITHFNLTPNLTT